MRAPVTHRTTDRNEPSISLEGLRCQLPDCDQRTRERKPYCSDHIEHFPYVAHLLAELAEREDELARVARQGSRAVRVEGLTAQEILLQLSLYGKRTTARLSRDLSLDEDVVKSYVRALARRGYVTLGWTSRKVMLVTPKRLDALLGDASSESAA